MSVQLSQQVKPLLTTQLPDNEPVKATEVDPRTWFLPRGWETKGQLLTPDLVLTTVGGWKAKPGDGRALSLPLFLSACLPT